MAQTKAKTTETLTPQKRHFRHTRSCADSVIVVRGKSKRIVIVQALLVLVGTIFGLYFVATKHHIAPAKTLKGVGRAGSKYKANQRKVEEQRQIEREEEEFVQTLDQQYDAEDMEMPCEFVVSTSVIPSCHGDAELLGTFALFNLKAGDIIDVNKTQQADASSAKTLYLTAHPTLANVQSDCTDPSLLKVTQDVIRGSELYINFDDECASRMLAVSTQDNYRLPASPYYDEAMEVIEDVVGVSRANTNRQGPGMNKSKVDMKYLSLIKKTIIRQSEHSCVAHLIPDDSERALQIAMKNGIIEGLILQRRNKVRLTNLVKNGNCASVKKQSNKIINEAMATESGFEENENNQEF